MTSFSTTRIIVGFVTTALLLLTQLHTNNGFTIHHPSSSRVTTTTTTSLFSTATKVSFIDTELRGAAMRLHTTKQAPREGKVKEEKESEPYVPTHEDYLQYLVDSQYVFQVLEDIVNEEDLLLQMFCNTGLERVEPLEHDIQWMCSAYKLSRPQVGRFGTEYATHIQSIKSSIPKFICHYYNFYFAHTAGGRMIGKQMSSLLLEKKTLEFYKWDGDLNKLKATTKDKIEEMAATWDSKQKQQCIDETAMAFRGGGGINAYLNGGKNKHH